MYCWGAKKEYRKIPKISPGAFTFQRPLLRGLFLEGLVFRGGGAYTWRGLFSEFYGISLVFMVTKILILLIFYKMLLDLLFQ